ncbi:MAG: hypothetical protein ACYSWQ_13830 [Planctomycetota bacterium]|jgi:hypothetical protein
MNYKQIIVVAVGAVAIAWAFLVPSWESYELAETDQGQVLLGKLENRLFNNPPEHGALCYFLRKKRSPIVDESQDKTSAAAAF